MGNNLLDSHVPWCENEPFSLWLMVSNYAYSLYLLCDFIRSLQVHINPEAPAARLPEDTVVKMRLLFDRMVPVSSELGLTQSHKLLVRILALWDRHGADHLFKQNRLGALHDRLRDELESVWFKRLDEAEATAYRSQAPFGREVNDRFPDAISDIQEAAKCFSLDRFVATVFHLMRVMELGVQFFGKRLKVKSTTAKTWNKILNDSQAAIKAMPRGTTAQKKRQERYAEIQAHLYNVKDAWRNATMHPKRTYTEEEARAICEYTATFMKALTSL